MKDPQPILYVEDDPRDVELTLAALVECHLANQIVVARDGQVALDFLRRDGRYESRAPGAPAFVLLDLKMPKVDGLEVLGQMKADETLRRIPVVMLTSSRAEQDLVRSYELGVNAYVVKPIDFGEFVRVIKDLGMFWAVINEVPPP
jgi:CheY-like chemotaxis protein